MSDPLILTLAMSGSGYETVSDWRARYFPDRGYTLPAHLTLFHHLPGDDPDAVHATIAGIAEDQTPLVLRVTEVLDFGGGAAVKVENDALPDYRARIASRFKGQLTDQDRRWGRPHITVQNKVDRETAQETLAELRDGFEPFEIDATGYNLWRYKGGPWEAVSEIPFGG